MNFPWILTVTLTLALPLGVGFYALIKDRSLLKPWILGLASFGLFQGLIRIPILQYVLPQQIWYILFQNRHPWLFIFFLSVTAALFEEGGRLLFFRFLLKKDAPLKSVLTFGLGHGGIEAMLLVGVPLLYIDVSSVASWQLLTAGFERVFAITLHVALSLWVYETLRTGKLKGLWVALILHTLVNLISVVSLQLGAPIISVEAFVALASISALVFALRERGVFHEENPDSIL